MKWFIKIKKQNKIKKQSKKKEVITRGPHYGFFLVLFCFGSGTTSVSEIFVTLNFNQDYPQNQAKITLKSSEKDSTTLHPYQRERFLRQGR